MQINCWDMHLAYKLQYLVFGRMMNEHAVTQQNVLQCTAQEGFCRSLLGTSDLCKFAVIVV